MAASPVACAGQPCPAAYAVTATRFARSASSQARAAAGPATGGAGVVTGGMRGLRWRSAGCRVSSAAGSGMQVVIEQPGQRRALLVRASWAAASSRA